MSREVLVRAVAKLKLTPAQLLDLNGYRELPSPPPPDGVYKAAPRDGVWATPPFLHNGSVPNLYEMLVPASERSKKFCIGREFDPDQSWVGHDLWARHVRQGYKSARKLERGSLVPGRAARRRRHRSAADRRPALGARRILEVDPGGARAGHAVRRSAGSEPAAEAVKLAPAA